MIMPRRTRLLRLFLLLCATLLFLYSYSPRFSNPNFDPNTLNLSQNSNLIPSNFTLIIKVLAFDRIDSLSRCLKSLAESDYERDRVDLHIFIDHFKILDSKNTELDKKLEESHRILKFVDEFSWNFGEKFMHYRTVNEGLQAQWLEAWWPSSDDEFAFVVEDDLELSPLYYKFLKRLILNYYYNPSNFNPSIYGASLQRPRYGNLINSSWLSATGKHGNKLHLDNQTHLFLYQIVGTWGQLLFPKPWKEFRIWYDIHKAKGIKPILQGMVTTGWYKKMGEKIWTPWFIKFIHSRGYYNIYTNLLHERSLSISHRDAGVNYGKTVGPDSYLLRKDNLDFNLWEMQPLNNLKWFDFCFQEIHPGRLVKSFDNFKHVFSYLHKQKSVILVSLFRSSDTITKNLLCHFERLNIRNYIFIGAPQELQLDLARRGHSVIDVGQLRNEINWQKFYNSGETHKEYIEEIILKAYILKEFLRLGFNTMVIDGNVVPLSNLFSDLFDSSYDISIAKEIDLLFVSQSPLIVKSWDDKFIYSLISLGLPFHTHFGDLVARSLEGKNLKINRFDEQNFSDARENGVHVNRTQIDARKKLIYWSFDMDWKFVQARLEAQGLWMIDNDSSCIAVICHQSDSNF